MSDELSRLESALNGVRQEQQSVFERYQLLKDLRLKEVEEGSPVYGKDINTPPPNYDDFVRGQLAREQRIQQYTEELKRLSLHYLELEAQRKSLVEQISELAQHPRE
ncbi:MAG TPA: hypothetical protein VIU93_15780 [Gallionellaceae bacterium]